MENYIKSADIEKIDWFDGTFRVHFKNGKIVAYKDVPEGLAVGMSKSSCPSHYLMLYITGRYPYEVEKTSEMEATDRPDLIPENLKDYLFSRITYNDLNNYEHKV